MRPRYRFKGLWLMGSLLAIGVLSTGCGYTTRTMLAPHLKTVYIEPFENKINIAALPTREDPFPVYRHSMEIDLTNEIVRRFQFTGIMRPSSQEKAHARLEGELVSFRRDVLRYDASRNVEEWRLNIVVNVRMHDLVKGTVLWEEKNFIGDTTYVSSGLGAESEEVALKRALTDLARRIVERTIENW